MKIKTFLLVAAIVMCAVSLSVQADAMNAQTDKTVNPFDSPLPTPSSTPISPEAMLAIQFVTEQHKIPVEQLSFGSEEPATFPLLGRNYIYVTVHYDSPDLFALFSVLVDPVTKEVEPDYNAVRAAEDMAYRNKYGKFEPSLYERLQVIAEDELLPVTIWAAHTNEDRSYEQIVTEVIKRYPDAEKAFNEKGILWMVEDANLSTEIQHYHEQLLTENAATRLQPMTAWLKERGLVVEEFSGMPAVAATLSKRVINELGKRSDVSEIFLIEAKSQPESDTAVPTDRTPTVWSRGIKGSGKRIAILEGYNINTTADACLDIYRVRLSTADPGHKSRVASVAACNDTVKRGMAYEAQIADAGHNGTQADAINALIWATDPNSTERAHVVNWSEGFESDMALHFTDRAYDYYVRFRYFTGVKSAGNTGGNVTSPGKGYNIISVGNVDDKNTVSWSDDEMRASSASTNPNTNVEKPEVVAPGTNIDTVTGQETGTSFAAPQVAGLAALLMQRDVDLVSYPSAVKAIIMASAVHNIEGDRRLSSIDGAGAIDAALADQIAQNEGGASACNSPCWWNHGTNLSPGLGNYIDRTFKANQGERIRVAIAWLSKPEPPTDTSPDSLLRNFDLSIISPSGIVSPSESPSNNFEIVEFVAPATGQYTIRVTRNTAGDGGAELGNQLGIAWTKQATYLPDIRSNSGGWTSSLYVRNDDAEPRTVRVTYFNANGTYNSEVSNTLQPAALWISPALPANWQGSAIVDGSEDLSVVVRNNAAGQANLDNGFLSIGSVVDPAFAQPATTLYAPALYINIFGGLNSAIYLQNPNKDAANVTLNFIARATYTDLNPVNLTLPANGSTAYFLGGSAWVGSLRVTATQPVAVKLTESQGSTVMRSYNATAVGKKLIYVPAAYKTYYGFNTGIVIQNLHASSATNVTITYCDRLYTTCYTETIPGGLPAQKAYGINLGTTTAIPPANWTGSVKVESTGNVPLALAVTNSNSVGGYDFNATGNGGKLIYLPRAARNASGRTTGYTIRNITNGNVTVTTTYYDVNGALHPGGVRTDILTPAKVVGYHQSLDGFLADGWEGSIVIESTDNVAVIMREDSVDTVSGYNGIAR